MSGWEGLDGAAIAFAYRSSENGSGRYEVAEIVARAFPERRAFADMVFHGLDLPLPSGPYQKDALKYIDKNVVEYRTPVSTEGLGNADSWLGKTTCPSKEPTS
jgi:hypothetical protein